MNNQPVNPDLQTWIEAAIGLHVRDGLPIGETPAALLDQLLAEILFFCGFNAPEEFRVAAEGGLLAAARSQGVTAGLTTDEAERWAGAVEQALAARNWQSIKDLPPDVWRWIKTLTGLDSAQWESLPSQAEALLDSQAVCPVCDRRGKLREIGRFGKTWEPLECGGGGSLSVKCSNCGQRLVLNAYDTLRPGFRHWGRILYWIAIACGVAVGAMMLMALRYIMFGRQ